MSTDAAEVFDWQAGREYDFRKYCLGESNRTQLSVLPYNNLETERHLMGFGKQAAVET